MEGFELFALAACALFGLGAFGAVTGTDMLRRVMALNVMAAGVFLLLVSLARRNVTGSGLTPDPVPQAMVLTGIVVSVSTTAFAVVLIRLLRTLDDEPDHQEPPA